MGCLETGTEGAIFIPGNTPSLKNSKVMSSRGIFHSKTVKKYLRSLGIQDFSSSKKEVKGYVRPPRLNVFKHICEGYFKQNEYPILLHAHFVRGTRHKCDFNNMTQIIADLLTAHDFIPDDDMDHLLFVPWYLEGQWYSYNKEKPGVYLKKMNSI